MLIRVEREEFTNKSTIGRLFIDGVFQCFTLEDVVRPVKIKGMTAIAAGMYEVVVSFSARFQRALPLLLNVPNFDGVRIHTGNTDADTEGCLLVGQSKSKDFVGASRAAFAPLFARIQAALPREKVFIEIVDGARASPAMRPAARPARRAMKRPGKGRAAGRAPARKAASRGPAPGRKTLGNAASRNAAARTTSRKSRSRSRRG